MNVFETLCWMFGMEVYILVGAALPLEYREQAMASILFASIRLCGNWSNFL